VTYAIGEADMYSRSALPYFTVNDKWYHFVPRGSDLEVQSTSRIDQSGCFVVHPAEFSFAAPSQNGDEQVEAENPPVSA
jgi:hypothetical protein